MGGVLVAFCFATGRRKFLRPIFAIYNTLLDTFLLHHALILLDIIEGEKGAAAPARRIYVLIVFSRYRLYTPPPIVHLGAPSRAADSGRPPGDPDHASGLMVREAHHEPKGLPVIMYYNPGR